MVCNIETTEITRSSRLVSRLTGYVVQPNKAIVGRNAFAHEAGIHQHGVLANPLTYEIMDATSVGLAQNSIVLGKHSGRHALSHALAELGYELDRDQLDAAFVRFKDVADRKGRNSAADIEALVGDEMRTEGPASFKLDHLSVNTGGEGAPSSSVVVTDADGGRHEGTATGDGPVNALMKAIDAAIGSEGKLLEYQVSSVTGGKDALGEARVVCDIGGRTYAGQGVSTDVLEASAIAYLRAVDASRRASTVSESWRRGVAAWGRRCSRRSGRRTRCARAAVHRPAPGARGHVPQAFDGLRLAGRKVRRPDRTMATVDHNVPTIGRDQEIADPLSRTQIEALERNCAEFGVPLFSIRSPRQGIVHVIGPELGLTQPGMTIVCGDSHTSTHGAFGALAFGIGTSEVEHVLATQTLPQSRARTMRVRIEGTRPWAWAPRTSSWAPSGSSGCPAPGVRGRVRRLGHPRALHGGRMTVCNMSIEWGARAGMIAPTR